MTGISGNGGTHEGKQPLLVVTGMSGAGKTQAMKALEDLGLFCIDNLPPTFLPQLADLYATAQEQGRQVAVATDTRGLGVFTDVLLSLETLQQLDVPLQILFLDCADEVLIRRFSETRRRHPLKTGGSLTEQIAEERRILADVRNRADLVIDTSNVRPADLKTDLARLVTGGAAESRMSVELVSFGFKHGVPLDADVIFDVRFLPNPFYVPELRPLTGLDAPVADFVLAQDGAEEWLDSTAAYLSRWLPAYAATDRARLTVAVGCTGGQHRSVALATELAERLRDASPGLALRHRDAPGQVPEDGTTDAD